MTHLHYPTYIYCHTIMSHDTLSYMNLQPHNQVTWQIYALSYMNLHPPIRSHDTSVHSPRNHTIIWSGDHMTHLHNFPGLSVKSHDQVIILDIWISFQKFQYNHLIRLSQSTYVPSTRNHTVTWSHHHMTHLHHLPWIIQSHDQVITWHIFTFSQEFQYSHMARLSYDISAPSPMNRCKVTWSGPHMKHLHKFLESYSWSITSHVTSLGHFYLVTCHASSMLGLISSSC